MTFNYNHDRLRAEAMEMIMRMINDPEPLLEVFREHEDLFEIAAPDDLRRIGFTEIRLWLRDKESFREYLSTLEDPACRSFWWLVWDSIMQLSGFSSGSATASLAAAACQLVNLADLEQNGMAPGDRFGNDVSG